MQVDRQQGARLEVSDLALELAERVVYQNTLRALAKHGRLGFISTHEAAKGGPFDVGTLLEEFHELTNALHCKEAADVSVVSLFTIASYNEALIRKYGPGGPEEQIWSKLPKTPGQLALEHLRAMSKPGNGYPKGIREDAAAALERIYKEAAGEEE